MELQNTGTPEILRAHADQLDVDADNRLRKAHAEADGIIQAAQERADALRRTARDYRAIADREDAEQRPETCRNCQTGIVRDSLGWKHLAEMECPEAAPFETRERPVATCEPGKTGPMPQVEQERPARPIGDLAQCPGCRQPVGWDGIGFTHGGATDCTFDLTGFDPQAGGEVR